MVGLRIGKCEFLAYLSCGVAHRKSNVCADPLHLPAGQRFPAPDRISGELQARGAGVQNEHRSGHRFGKSPSSSLRDGLARFQFEALVAMVDVQTRAAFQQVGGGSGLDRHGQSLAADRQPEAQILDLLVWVETESPALIAKAC